ncbi:MAG: 4Fe-4S cluster-binding domain-containing protein, partial [Leptospiraceae bacterium]|nr:4Fe-4S cluster-binding domain-containing protein [Leptospiraceae bacterium]
MNLSVLNVYLKVTEQCNLHCTHCYMRYQKKRKEIICFYKFEKLMDKLFDSRLVERFNIIFHGGEPMLMGIKFYEWVLENWFHPRVTYSIQTNLTLYSPEWDYIFRHLFNSKVGSSFDLSRRLDGSFVKFYQVWKQALSMVQRENSVGLRITGTKPLLEKGPIEVYRLLSQFGPIFYDFDYYISAN